MEQALEETRKGIRWLTERWLPIYRASSVEETVKAVREIDPEFDRAVEMVQQFEMRWRGLSGSVECVWAPKQCPASSPVSCDACGRAA